MINKIRKGFTLLEMVISLAMTSIFLLTVIYFPTQLAAQYKEFKAKIDYTESVINVFQSFSKDISAENGKIIVNVNDVTIGSSKYLFSETGIQRNNVDNLKLTRFPASYSVNNNKITIDIPNSKGKDVTLKYDLNFSSFPNEVSP